MKRIIFLSFAFSLLVMIFTSCSKDSPVESQKNLTFDEKLQKALDDGIESQHGKGVSAAVVFENQDMWSGTSGISFGSTAITKDMVFGVGSVTKTFVAPLCLQLAHEGVFILDDSLHKWLPTYNKIDSSITIRQLLYNTSGIYNITDNTALWDAVFNDPAKLWTPEELISSFLEEPYSTPGAGWFYSNMNYILLGMIINEATGSLVSAELRNRFFQPLGLNSTFLDVEETVPSKIAHGWFDLSGNGSYDDISLIPRTGISSVLWTSGAIFSTAEDLARWSSALFGGNVLSQPSLDQMLTPCCTLPGTSDVGCGMGVFLIGPNNNTGVALIGYTGRTFGYLTSMFYVPDYGTSVVVIINDDDSACLDVITTDVISEVIDHSGL